MKAYQILLNKDSTDKLGNHNPLWYVYLCICTGKSNATISFQQFKDEVVYDLDCCIIYLDEY